MAFFETAVSGGPSDTISSSSEEFPLNIAEAMPGAVAVTGIGT